MPIKQAKAATKADDPDGTVQVTAQVGAEGKQTGRAPIVRHRLGEQSTGLVTGGSGCVRVTQRLAHGAAPVLSAARSVQLRSVAVLTVGLWPGPAQLSPLFARGASPGHIPGLCPGRAYGFAPATIRNTTGPRAARPVQEVRAEGAGAWDLTASAALLERAVAFDGGPGPALPTGDPSGGAGETSGGYATSGLMAGRPCPRSPRSTSLTKLRVDLLRAQVAFPPAAGYAPALPLKGGRRLEPFGPGLGARDLLGCAQRP